MIFAVTGATGFVGSRVVDLALAASHRVRALTRRPQPDREGVTWVRGDLGDPGDLTEGADAVVHIAGVVNAPNRAGFAAGNIDGTRTIVAASATKRFIHVSSLSAREPSLSNYGWSKAEGERLVEESTLDWTIVRPPGVYGPGDMEMRDVFRLAKRGLALTPPAGRVSLIHVDDLARLLLACATSPVGPRVLEPAGGAPLTHAEMATAVGVAVGRHVLPIALPGALLMLAARADRLVRGSKAKLTPDRVGYLTHPDWTADPARAPDPALWQARIATDVGLAATARWYRAHGLL